MKRTDTKMFAKHTWLPALAALALIAGIAIIATTWRARPTGADGVNCSGNWWESTDPAVISICSDQKASANQPVLEMATLTAQPYYDTMPNYTPVPELPEATYDKEVREMVFDLNDPGRGPTPREWRGATSIWRDGAVPRADYMLWSDLYVVSRPHGMGPISSINPTLETMIPDGDSELSIYVRQWTCPQSVGALHITSITNPDYANTDPHVAYPGLRSVVYFTTDSSSWPTGSFNMATQTWTLDPVNNLPNPASDDGP